LVAFEALFFRESVGLLARAKLMGSARVSRAGDCVLAIANFSCEFSMSAAREINEKIESKHWISFLNLSGFATLRETFVIKVKEEFFTLRRQGAKDGGQF
jgi:hypothetical protein